MATSQAQFTGMDERNTPKSEKLLTASRSLTPNARDR